MFLGEETKRLRTWQFFGGVKVSFLMVGSRQKAEQEAVASRQEPWIWELDVEVSCI